MDKNMSIRLKKVSLYRSGVNTIEIIHMVLALIIIVWLNGGLFTYLIPYIPDVVGYMLCLAWLSLAFCNRRFVKIFIVQTWPLLLFNLYMVFISLFVNIDLTIYIRSISYLILVYTIFLYYFNEINIRFQKILCIFLILDCIAVGINTYVKLKTNPVLARYLATGVETKELFLGTGTFPGVGSYSYFYALVAFILLLSFLFLNQRKRKISFLISIVVAITVLIQGSFTMSIIFTFIFITLLIIIRYSNKHTTVAIVILGIIALLIFQGTFAMMFSQLADIQGLSSTVSARFSSLADFFYGNDVSGTDLEKRQIKYLQSVYAFANNILVGTVFADSSVYRAGGHAAWIDLLATFGLFSFPFFMFLYKAYKYCKNRVPIVTKSFVQVYWMYFIFLGFVNTLLFAHIYITWFFFLPVFINTYFKMKKNYPPERFDTQPLLQQRRLI